MTVIQEISLTLSVIHSICINTSFGDPFCDDQIQFSRATVKMLALLDIILILVPLSAATPISIRANNPISLASSVLLGNQTSSNDPGTYRDGGWEGEIGSNIFRVYGMTKNLQSKKSLDLRFDYSRYQSL